jgi:hypothetical protein
MLINLPLKPVLAACENSLVLGRYHPALARVPYYSVSVAPPMMRSNLRLNLLILFVTMFCAFTPPNARPIQEAIWTRVSLKRHALGQRRDDASSRRRGIHE